MIETARLKDVPALNVKLVPTREMGGLAVFADAYGSYIGRDSVSGSIFAVDKEDNGVMMFVNKNFGAYIQFQDKFLDYATKVQDLDDHEADELVANVFAELKSLDRKAFESADTWWSVVVEQMEAGLI